LFVEAYPWFSVNYSQVNMVHVPFKGTTTPPPKKEKENKRKEMIYQRGTYHFHGKTRNSGWKIKWYATFHLESFRKYGL